MNKIYISISACLVGIICGMLAPTLTLAIITSIIFNVVILLIYYTLEQQQCDINLLEENFIRLYNERGNDNG